MIADPFSLPEAIVVLEIPGLKNPGFNLNTVDHHDLLLDESLDDVYTTVEDRMRQRLVDKEYSLIRGSLANEEFVRLKKYIYNLTAFELLNNYFQLKTQVFHPNYKLNPNIKPNNVDSYDEKYKVFLNDIFYLHQLGQGVSK